ncbi:uncharacterized protein LOC120731883 isoform X2 [Simochromis diagramma]|uniref:uncharacterized protein LOC120731883 isoform X2 n=1 Tax=Simochromis diagramma TaxID=43689 RepID=UPI001A7E2B51|nr:uncharacterized protein LOC120731883 isoform X2 [Simochromis diagramma]
MCSWAHWPCCYSHRAWTWTSSRPRGPTSHLALVSLTAEKGPCLCPGPAEIPSPFSRGSESASCLLYGRKRCAPGRTGPAATHIGHGPGPPAGPGDQHTPLLLPPLQLKKVHACALALLKFPLHLAEAVSRPPVSPTVEKMCSWAHWPCCYSHRAWTWTSSRPRGPTSHLALASLTAEKGPCLCPGPAEIPSPFSRGSESASCLPYGRKRCAPGRTGPAATHIGHGPGPPAGPGDQHRTLLLPPLQLKKVHACALALLKFPLHLAEAVSRPPVSPTVEKDVLLGALALLLLTSGMDLDLQQAPGTNIAPCSCLPYS